MKTLLRFNTATAALLFALTTFALDLGEAKSRGLIGEQANGYLAAVGVATPEIAALVNDINTKRKAAYEAIAQKNGTALDTVEQLAGQKAIEKTAPGQYVRGSDGKWAQVK
jgi:uncharacterized protein YdbL (DUF1318 family)